MTRRTPIWPALLLLLLAVGAIVAARLLPSLDELLVQRERRAGGSATLTEIRRIGELETLTYVQRVVFPHDYLDPELSVAILLRRIAAVGGTAREALDERELRHFLAANLAAELGLAVSRDSDRYVVVTSVLRFGYRLDSLAARLEALDHDEEAAPVSIPPAELLETVTEDIVPDRYPYGPIPLDADGWRRVSQFVAREAAATAPLDSLIADASAGGRDIFAYLLGREVVIESGRTE